MFPNLTVVRGMELFKDFAVVIFDNGHLEVRFEQQFSKLLWQTPYLDAILREPYILEYKTYVIPGYEVRFKSKSFLNRLRYACQRAAPILNAKANQKT